MLIAFFLLLRSPLPLIGDIIIIIDFVGVELSMLKMFSILFAQCLIDPLDLSLIVVDLGKMCEMSDVDVENMAILSFTLFSDFSSLFRQLSVGR